jgi:hypothetical protein
MLNAYILIAQNLLFPTMCIIACPFAGGYFFDLQVELYDYIVT